MIVDLSKCEADRNEVADVCVVGAGIAGLILATELRRRGLSVVVLESGDERQDDEEHPLNRVVNIGRTYDGATLGRARCLGGTSTRWGGALIPFIARDLEDKVNLNVPAWPVKFEELVPYIREIERLFDVDGSPYDESYLTDQGIDFPLSANDPDFLTRFAKWPTFKKRNVATILKSQLTGSDGPLLFLNATVCQFESDRELGRLLSVRARSISGRKVSVAAKKFAFCAGAIETTRLMLLFDRQNDDRIFASCNSLGRYFHDHVSMPAARIHPRQQIALNKIAGFRFSGQTMRSLRFELSPNAQAEEGVASSFGHISFVADGHSGFNVLRDVLRGLQKRGIVSISEVLSLARDFPYLFRAAYWRYMRKQLLWPHPARYELHVVAEQLPRASNRITLAEECDTFRCPLAAIDWNIDQPELRTIRAFANRFDKYWSRNRLDEIAALDWQFDLNSTGPMALPEHAGDIFHPGGTTRMGADRTSSIVDSELKAHAVPNLSIASTSIFPSGASANPTLMLMAFTLRLADRLADTASG